MLQVEKEDPNLITVFVCFLRSGLRFTRYDTNNVGLAFIEEIKRLNPDFKPVKVQQRERDQVYTVNAYPREFEQLIMSLIEEYRKKNNLEYRLKKPAKGGFRKPGGGPKGGGYGRPTGSRPGSYNPDSRRQGSGWQGPDRPNYNRPDRGQQGPGYSSSEGRTYSRPDGNRPDSNRPGGGYQGGERQNYNRPDGNRQGGGWQGGERQGYNRPEGNRQGGSWQGGNRQGGYRPRDPNDQGGYPRRRDDQTGGNPPKSENKGYLEGGYRPGYSPYNDDQNLGSYKQTPRPSGFTRSNYIPNKKAGDQFDDSENKRPRRPRKDQEP